MSLVDERELICQSHRFAVPARAYACLATFSQSASHSTPPMVSYLLGFSYGEQVPVPFKTERKYCLSLVAKIRTQFALTPSGEGVDAGGGLSGAEKRRRYAPETRKWL